MQNMSLTESPLLPISEWDDGAQRPFMQPSKSVLDSGEKEIQLCSTGGLSCLFYIVSPTVAYSLGAVIFILHRMLLPILESVLFVSLGSYSRNIYQKYQYPRWT